jgi:hypothetical protein
MAFSPNAESVVAEEVESDDADLAFKYDGLYDEDGFRAIGIDPVSPTVAKPGSDEKVIMLAARYASGLPLWHNEDCYDHGPGGRLAAGLSGLGGPKSAK